jgi:predicted AAA+ superfamily ATPase
VDFVAEKPTIGREYFQVCYNVYLEETRDRELTPLRLIQDNFPKTVLTMNAGRPSVTKDGIQVKDVVRWLLNEDE